MTVYDPTAPLGTPRNPRRVSLCVPFKRHYSPAHGRKLTAWDEYRRANKELGLVDVGQKPAHPADTTPAYSPKRATIVPDDAPKPHMLTGTR